MQDRQEYMYGPSGQNGLIICTPLNRNQTFPSRLTSAYFLGGTRNGCKGLPLNRGGVKMAAYTCLGTTWPQEGFKMTVPVEGIVALVSEPAKHRVWALSGSVKIIYETIICRSPYI